MREVLAALQGRTGTVVSLGVAQTLAWASTYYLPAMLAAPMAHDLGVSTPFVFGAFSVALLMAALVGPKAGSAIDRWGGRPVLSWTSLVFAVGLFSLGNATGPWSLMLAWVVIGGGMASGLYEAAFATVVRIYGKEARGAITGITLLAGFASTVGWPLSAYLEARYGWRVTCWVWAGLHVVVGLPLNLSLANGTATSATSHMTKSDAAVAVEHVPRQEVRASRTATYVLAFVFAATWFTSTAMAAHLPALLQACGVAAATSVLVGMLIGPAQVAARLLEFGLLRRMHPLISSRLAAALHPLGGSALLLAGPPMALLFGVLHGAGNGILTIAKGTLPLAVFGPQGYGHRQGVLMVPARIAQALAPWLFGPRRRAVGASSLARDRYPGRAFRGGFVSPSNVDSGRRSQTLRRLIRWRQAIRWHAQKSKIPGRRHSSSSFSPPSPKSWGATCHICGWFKTVLSGCLSPRLLA